MSTEAKKYAWGIRCRKCGCRHHATAYTRPRAGGKIARRRVCRHCGYGFTTYEVLPGSVVENSEGGPF